MKIDHLQDYLYMTIGSQICLNYIYDLWEVLVYLKTRLIYDYFFYSFILSVILKISFEIIFISLFFFSKIIRENSVWIVPSFICSIKHSLLSSCVIYWVHIFSALISEYLVWNLVNFLNCLSNFLIATSALIKFS